MLSQLVGYPIQKSTSLKIYACVLARSLWKRPICCMKPSLIGFGASLHPSETIPDCIQRKSTSVPCRGSDTAELALAIRAPG